MCEHWERAARTSRLIKSAFFFSAAAGKLWKFRHVPTAAWFPCFTAGGGSDDRGGRNGACDFLRSAEAVISRLCLVCRAAITPLAARCATRRQDAFHQETSEGETFGNQTAPSQALRGVKLDVMTVKREEPEVKKIKGHSGQWGHKQRFGASQKVSFVSANHCLKCPAATHCDGVICFVMLYLTTFFFFFCYTL